MAKTSSAHIAILSQMGQCKVQQEAHRPRDVHLCICASELLYLAPMHSACKKCIGQDMGRYESMNFCILPYREERVIGCLVHRALSVLVA
jgi:hypothetical protein